MKNRYSKNLTSKLITKIITSTLIYTITFITIFLIARLYCTSARIWQPYDLEYKILKTIDKNPLIILFVWLLGFLLIFIYNLKKSLSLIDAIINVTDSLIEDNDKKINLPEELVEVEDKLNYLKQKSILNKNKALENEKRKDDLIIYLAHDIKTPLTSMIGYLSLLEEIDDMPKKQRQKYIKTALDKSYKLEELINELFDITRFNSSKIILNKEELNLNLMLEQIIDDFYPILNSTNKKIDLNANTKITLEGDSNLLGRVFNNIIKNAISYSKDNSTITITTKVLDNDIQVKVSNLGKKISKENLDKMFEKFYRLDDARTTKTGGSGLGLAIAKEIVELHSGSIYATSTNEETSIYVELPLK